MVLWLIGLSGAGKTAIGKEVYGLLKEKGRNVVFLDGDTIREVMGNDLGHTIADRRKNADRVCRLCRFLESQDIAVVCSILSIFEESRVWNRQELKNYYEVFISVPLDELIKRDAKGLYRRALNGEADVVGLQIPFNEPAQSDLIVDNSGHRQSTQSIAAEIVAAIPF